MTTPTKGPFAIAMQDGTRQEVTGWRGVSVGVHEVAPKVWSVTHLPTGRRSIADPLCCEADALAVLELLDDLLPATGDWDRAPDARIGLRAYYLTLGWMFTHGYFDED